MAPLHHGRARDANVLASMRWRLVAGRILAEDADPMSRFPGAEIGADELPDEVHLLADQIESITGKDVYFIDARRHRFETGQLPPGMPPPPVSGPPSGPDVLVFVNPDGVEPQMLSNSIRRFLIQALLVWEGYPMSGLKADAVDAATVGPMQQWLHMGLLAAATEQRFAQLTATPPEPRRFSRLPPFRVPPDVRVKLVALESAMGLAGHPGEISADARSIAEALRQSDLGTPSGFRAAFGSILELWGLRSLVILGVADKESGTIAETPW